MIESIHQPFGLLEGKVAVVTGAGRGIGRAIARAFVQQGAKVLAADFSGEENDTAAALARTSSLATRI